WLSSPDYIAPERALCAVLAQDSALVAQVRRYNNYRRVLYTDRPGPLPREREEERWFTTYRCEATSIVSDAHSLVSATSSPLTDLPASRSSANTVAKQMVKDSPQRILKRTKKTEKDLRDSGDSVSSLQEHDDVREKSCQQPSEPSAVAEHHPLKRGQTATPQARRSRPLPAPAQESAPCQREPGEARPQGNRAPGGCIYWSSW
ncbi:MAG TPA: hypothetical protein VFV38_28595, partial [Ktedonobacteraceae bacterium]|nr:hypothetical protein [Ktedonobacteraceae bacterium]